MDRSVKNVADLIKSWTNIVEKHAPILYRDMLQRPDCDRGWDGISCCWSPSNRQGEFWGVSMYMSFFIEHSTQTPDEAERLCNEAKELGIHWDSETKRYDFGEDNPSYRLRLSGWDGGYAADVDVTQHGEIFKREFNVIGCFNLGHTSPEEFGISTETIQMREELDKRSKRANEVTKNVYQQLENLLICTPGLGVKQVQDLVIGIEEINACEGIIPLFNQVQSSVLSIFGEEGFDTTQVQVGLVDSRSQNPINKDTGGKLIEQLYQRFTSNKK